VGAALRTIRDLTGSADVDGVRSAFSAAFFAYEGHGRPPRKPISIVIEPMPIMGATQSMADGHILHVALHATKGEMLQGLIAHEMGHMVLTEEGHPSHDPEIQDRAMSRLAVQGGLRRGFNRLASEAINHAQDIYADDLAIPLVVADRAYPFFAEWIRNAASSPPGPWEDVAAAITIGFALGNLERHGFLRANDPVWREAKDFAARRKVTGLDRIAAFYRDLPMSVTRSQYVDVLAGFLQLVLAEVHAKQK